MLQRQKKSRAWTISSWALAFFSSLFLNSSDGCFLEVDRTISSCAAFINIPQKHQEGGQSWMLPLRSCQHPCCFQLFLLLPICSRICSFCLDSAVPDRTGNTNPTLPDGMAENRGKVMPKRVQPPWLCALQSTAKVKEQGSEAQPM